MKSTNINLMFYSLIDTSQLWNKTIATFSYLNKAFLFFHLVLYSFRLQFIVETKVKKFTKLQHPFFS